MPASGSAERRTVATWQAAGAALRQIRARELQALTDREAVSAFEDLYALVAGEPVVREISGLVEQQRLFRRLRS
ncbi:MAG TPA: hypothetical protein VNU01_07210 [Egibacteraceae bacterium]|nr:hypothetical protein [Egibacteraceae bacterium]